MDGDKGLDSHSEPIGLKMKTSFSREKTVTWRTLMDGIKETLKFCTYLKFQMSLETCFLLMIPGNSPNSSAYQTHSPVSLVIKIIPLDCYIIYYLVSRSHFLEGDNVECIGITDIWQPVEKLNVQCLWQLRHDCQSYQ